MANAPQPNPMEELARDISSVQSDLNSLQSKVRLSNVVDSIEDLDSKLAGLPQVIEGLRKRGYAFEKILDTQAQTLSQRWRGVEPVVRSRSHFQSQELAKSLPAIEAKMSHLASLSRAPSVARPVYSQVKTEIENLTEKAEAAESALRSMYNDLETEYNKINAHLQDVDKMLTQLAQASFTLLPTEAGIMSVKAVYTAGPKEDNDDPEGILFLTDQRIIFEQKEEVATKKVLFITTERKLVQKLLFEVPLALIEDVKPSKQGMFKNEDHLDIFFAVGAPMQKAHLHIDGQDCNEWQALIKRAKTKDFDRDRAVAVDQTEVEKVKAAPTICPACGGTINKPVLRGQESITCDYCGNVIRL